MRRLVLELYGEQFQKRFRASSFRDIESLELLHLLHYDRKELAGIWRISSNNPSLRPEETLKYDGSRMEVRLLEREKGGSSIVFMRRMRRKQRADIMLDHDNVMGGGGYLIGPFEVKDGRLKITFVGSQGYVRKILGRIESRGFKYKVLSLGDAGFAPGSLLNRLTDKQRHALLLAYQLGYYDVPRRIGSEEIANRLKLRRATVVEHLRKAERRLLTEVVEGQSE